MKKGIFLMLVVLLSLYKTQAQSAKLDTVAVAILDRMSEMIGELGSCTATINSEYDVFSSDLGLVKHTDQEHIYIGGKDKMLIRSEGDKGNRQLVYNGKTLSYYSVDKNHYSQVSVPNTLVEMIDYMNKDYGIVFPMADFLYPTFVDDILAEANNLVLLGITKVNGVDCYHIAGSSKDKTFQFWISEAPYFFPVKLVIVNTAKEMNPQYEATYSDWQVNPNLPSGIFEFRIPPNAKKIKLHEVNPTSKK